MTPEEKGLGCAMRTGRPMGQLEREERRRQLVIARTLFHRWLLSQTDMRDPMAATIADEGVSIFKASLERETLTQEDFVKDGLRSIGKDNRMFAKESVA